MYQATNRRRALDAPDPQQQAAETADATEEETALVIARAQTGDKAAFALLYRRHHRRAYALCVRLLNDQRLAEDLTQDTFIKAWQQLRSFRGDAKFSTWLQRIAVNTVISWQRKNGRWLRWLNADHDEIPETSHPENCAATIDLETAIGKLPLRARQVFVLIDLEGYSHEEASHALGMAAGTSKAQLSRARKLLRGMLT